MINILSRLFLVASILTVASACLSKREGDIAQDETEATVIDSSRVATPVRIKADPGDSLILLQFFRAMHGNLWRNSWPLGLPVQSWKGVYLNQEGRVSEIILPSNGLTGMLPNSMYKLTALQKIDLSNNPVKGTILIPESEDGYGTKYDFNTVVNQRDETRLRDSVWYLYAEQPVPIYTSLKKDTIVDYVSNEKLGYIRDVIIDDEKLTNPSAGTATEGGLTGRYIKVNIEHLKLSGYMFSGHLSRIPPIENYSPEKFIENLLLVNSSETSCCYKQDGKEFIPGMSDERNGSNWKYQFEGGISLEGYSGYEWGGSTVVFDANLISFQEAFLFAQHLFRDVFNKYGVTEFPSRQMSFKPNDYTTVTVEYSGIEIQSIKIEEGDGCVQEWFVRRSENRIEVGSSAGC